MATPTEGTCSVTAAGSSSPKPNATRSSVPTVTTSGPGTGTRSCATSGNCPPSRRSSATATSTQPRSTSFRSGSARSAPATTSSGPPFNNCPGAPRSRRGLRYFLKPGVTALVSPQHRADEKKPEHSNGGNRDHSDRQGHGYSSDADCREYSQYHPNLAAEKSDECGYARATTFGEK